MYNDNKSSWFIGIILIIIVLVISIYLIGRPNDDDDDRYRVHGVNDVIDTILNERIGNDDYDEYEEQEEQQQYSIVDDGYYEEEEVIDLEPDLPPAFLPDNSVGEESLVPRSKPEKICRRTLEKIYGKKFSRIRPDWLRNPKTGRNLEIDCYNDELKIGLEYNGVQHYKWPNFTKMSRQQFLDQVERDHYKIDKCDEMGVYLITVPYNIPYRLIPDYIKHWTPEKVMDRQKYGID